MRSRRAGASARLPGSIREGRRSGRRHRSIRRQPGALEAPRRYSLSALAAHGFGKADFDLAAIGDAGAVSSSGAAAPLRRRADIFFELAAQAR